MFLQLRCSVVYKWCTIRLTFVISVLKVFPLIVKGKISCAEDKYPAQPSLQQRHSLCQGLNELL